MRRNIHVPSILLAALLGNAGAAHAAAFALIEQSASGMGNAYAGAAASAEDASTIYFNPAGMTRLSGKQAVIAAHAIRPAAEFSNAGSATPLRHPLAGGGFFPLGGDGGDAGSWAFVPNAYFSAAITDNLYLGIGANAPFGLKTEYNDGWMGRYQALKSEIRTININPTLAYKFNDAFSVGIGASWQRIDAELTNTANLVTQEGFSKLKGDDDSWGWNIGVLLNLTPDTRIGASYRSEIDYTLEGDVRITNAAGATVVSNPIRAGVTMPDSYSISLVHRISPQWEVLADYTYTRWDEIQSIDIINANTGAMQSSLSLLFDNSFRAALGANYQYSDQLKLRFGVAFDESPVKGTATRTARLPDSDRTWLAIGANYQLTSQGSLDVGYAHLFIKDGGINSLRGTALSPASSGNLVGDYENNVNILSVQYTHTF